MPDRASPPEPTRAWSIVRAEGAASGSPRAEQTAGVGTGPPFRALLLGSLLLHAVLLAPAWMQRHSAGAPLVSSPFGARSDAEPAIDSALVEVPVHLEPPPTPATPPATEADDPSAAAVPVELRAEPVAPRSEQRPAPARAAAAARPPVQRPAAAEPPAPASEYDDGEDWLSLADQLSPETGTETRTGESEHAADAPSDSGSAAEPDPLIERLLAAERRKALQRRSLARPPSAVAEAPPPPPAPSDVPRAAASTVVDVPVALTRWLSEQAPTNPRWRDLDPGTHRALVTLRLRDGRLLDSAMGPGAHPALGAVLNGALYYLGKRHLPGGSVHAASGELQVVVEAQLSRDSAADSRERLPAIRHFTTKEGRYLPRARVQLPSGTRIDIRVSIDGAGRSTD